jgi:hypothetical protein
VHSSEKPTGVQKVAVLAFSGFFLATPIVGYLIRKAYGQAVLERVAPYWGWCGVGLALAVVAYILLAKYGKPHA